MRTDGILDARPLYFRLALESASNSIYHPCFLVFLSFPPPVHNIQLSYGSVMYSYEIQEEREADR